MNKSQIARELQSHLASAIAAHKVKLGDIARNDIEFVVTRAAGEIEELQRAKQAAKLLQAKAAMRALIDTMMIARDELPGYRAEHGDLIGEKTFMWAKETLCPIWPICD